MNWTLYGLFLMIAIPTILSPGPGVLMSVTNSLRYGLFRALPGIAGIAAGSFVVALISATGLGVVLTASPDLYNAVKLVGIAYLFYLGYKKFKARPFDFKKASAVNETVKKRRAKLGMFMEAIALQLSNPALIIFYISLFPQCIDPSLDYVPQFLFLASNYALLVFVLHVIYGWMAAAAAEKLLRQENTVWIDRVSALAFWLMGALLLAAMF